MKNRKIICAILAASMACQVSAVFNFSLVTKKAQTLYKDIKTKAEEVGTKAKKTAKNLYKSHPKSFIAATLATLSGTGIFAYKTYKAFTKKPKTKFSFYGKVKNLAFSKIGFLIGAGLAAGTITALLLKLLARENDIKPDDAKGLILLSNDLKNIQNEALKKAQKAKRILIENAKRKIEKETLTNKEIIGRFAIHRARKEADTRKIDQEQANIELDIAIRKIEEKAFDHQEAQRMKLVRDGKKRQREEDALKKEQDELKKIKTLISQRKQEMQDFDKEKKIIEIEAANEKSKQEKENLEREICLRKSEEEAFNVQTAQQMKLDKEKLEKQRKIDVIEKEGKESDKVLALIYQEQEIKEFNKNEAPRMHEERQEALEKEKQRKKELKKKKAKARKRKKQKAKKAKELQKKNDGWKIIPKKKQVKKKKSELKEYLRNAKKKGMKKFTL